jgi:hypothetical protein
MPTPRKTTGSRAPKPPIFKAGIKLDASQVKDMRGAPPPARLLSEAELQSAFNKAWLKREAAARAHGSKVPGRKPSADIRRGA